MHPCQFAYAFLVASSMLFIGIKKIKAKEEKKEVLHYGRRRQKFGYWQSISGFMSTASKRIKEPCNFLVSKITMDQK